MSPPARRPRDAHPNAGALLSHPAPLPQPAAAARTPAAATLRLLPRLVGWRRCRQVRRPPRPAPPAAHSSASIAALAAALQPPLRRPRSTPWWSRVWPQSGRDLGAHHTTACACAPPHMPFLLRKTYQAHTCCARRAPSSRSHRHARECVAVDEVVQELQQIGGRVALGRHDGLNLSWLHRDATPLRTAR